MHKFIKWFPFQSLEEWIFRGGLGFEGCRGAGIFMLWDFMQELTF